MSAEGLIMMEDEVAISTPREILSGNKRHIIYDYEFYKTKTNLEYVCFSRK